MYSLPQKMSFVGHAAGQRVAALFAAVFSFSLAELTTGQVILATVFAFLSAVVAAWLASRPAILRERRASRAADLAFLHDRIRYSGQLLALTRRSKHNVLDELNSAYARIRVGQVKLDEAKIIYEPYRFKTYEELCGDEDREVLELSVAPDPEEWK